MIDINLADVVYGIGICFVLFAGGMITYAMNTRRELTKISKKLKDLGVIRE